MTEDGGGESAERILAAAPALARPRFDSRTFPRVESALFEAIRSHPAQKLVLQVPAGLTRNAHRLAGEIRERTGKSVILAARACFGACDFPSADEAPGAGLAVVLGHARIPNVELARPTFFVEMRESGGDAEALSEVVLHAHLPARLGIVASVQHLDLLPTLTRALASRGFHVESGAGESRLAYPDQALGCNYTSAQAVEGRVDAFLFLGTGRFHPLGLAFAVDRPVWALDPLQGTLEPPIDRGALIRKRQLLVASVMDARRFGLLVSSFAGQNRHPMALALQRRALDHGREAEILVFDRLDPRDLEGRDLDAYVNTACPRIALDDSDLYPRPVLTPPEFLMALGELPLEPYRFDTFR
ncbi:MAG TPA: diphthamide biosynthesis enzyme Dph2 [Thermoplasmata archaeon]|nr:diphthamide biosynthesis enzyme Dph2 [Thermoplasmata archaeon]